MIDAIRTLLDAKARRLKKRDELRGKLQDARDDHRAAVASDDDAAAEKAYARAQRLQADLAAIEATIAETENQQADRERQAEQEAHARRIAECETTRADVFREALEFERLMGAAAEQWHSLRAAIEVALASERRAGVSWLKDHGLLHGRLWARVCLRFMRAINTDGTDRVVFPSGVASPRLASVADYIASQGAGAAAAPQDIE